LTTLQASGKAPAVTINSVAAAMSLQRWDTVGQRARLASRALRLAEPERKSAALHVTAQQLRDRVDAILDANASDMEVARAAGRPASFLDRLTLTPARIRDIAASVDAVADLTDPVGQTLDAWTRPNGLRIARVRVPLGVIGLIYESRPNVTADAAALCIKSGNAAVLRGGSESLNSNRAIHACLEAGLREAGLPEDAAILIDTPDRAVVGAMLEGLGGGLDVIVPRGGKSLVARVQAEARVPVFAHLEGICHVYVDRDADEVKARAIVVNAKMRRTGICGAAEALLVHRDREDLLRLIVRDLLDAGCEVRGDAIAQAADPRVKPAVADDWGKEFLDSIIAVRTVDSLDDAMGHIARYGSQHTDAIVTENADAAARFLREVDSAIVIHNASTQFADGGEFGMGAEIGIATGRFHARGPVGVEQLTTFKYVVEGNGQTRP
jgi:glutamate-5-semialdehyde dehydrogenase